LPPGIRAPAIAVVADAFSKSLRKSFMRSSIWDWACAQQSDAGEYRPSAETILGENMRTRILSVDVRPT
jgi:hypothetical protein